MTMGYFYIIWKHYEDYRKYHSNQHFQLPCGIDREALLNTIILDLTYTLLWVIFTLLRVRRKRIAERLRNQRLETYRGA